MECERKRCAAHCVCVLRGVRRYDGIADWRCRREWDGWISCDTNTHARETNCYSSLSSKLVLLYSTHAWETETTRFTILVCRWQWSLQHTCASETSLCLHHNIVHCLFVDINIIFIIQHMFEWTCVVRSIECLFSMTFLSELRTISCILQFVLCSVSARQHSVFVWMFHIVRVNIDGQYISGDYDCREAQKIE